MKRINDFFVWLRKTFGLFVLSLPLSYIFWYIGFQISVYFIGYALLFGISFSIELYFIYRRKPAAKEIVKVQLSHVLVVGFALWTFAEFFFTGHFTPSYMYVFWSAFAIPHGMIAFLLYQRDVRDIYANDFGKAPW